MSNYKVNVVGTKSVRLDSSQIHLKFKLGKIHVLKGESERKNQGTNTLELIQSVFRLKIYYFRQIEGAIVGSSCVNRGVI